MLKFFFVLLMLSMQVFAEEHGTISLQRYDGKIVATINHDEGWHTYWKNPGDSGLPSAFKFTSNGTAVELKASEWPVPKKYLEAGDILTIGYAGKQHFFFEDKKIDLDAHITFLICKDICIPGEAKLKLGKDVNFISSRPSSPYGEAELKEAFAYLPVDTTIPPQFEYYLTRVKEKNLLTLHYSLKGVKNPKLAKELLWLTPFPHAPFGFKRESVYFDGNTLYGKTEIEWDGEYQEPVVPLPASGSFPQAYDLDFLYNPPGDGKVQKIKLQIKDFSLFSPSLNDFYKTLKPVGFKGEVQGAEVAKMEGSIFRYLLLAFLGGLILNLMPCVLPVISIKLFGLIKHQDYSQKKLFAHNLSYTAGVIATFMALALVIVGLKATGEEVGWGFQLQSPAFILIMMLILFILSLNLFGLFEFQTPGGNKLGNAKTEDGFSGDFFSGVLTTILSTPCSAPFLGTALAFALTANNFIIFLMFFFIGLGLAFPFLLTAVFPKTLHIFPRPGAWMEKLKYFLGLTLLVTIIWLYDVFVTLVDFDQLSWRLNLLFALWFFAFFFFNKISKQKILALAFFILPLGLTAMAIESLEMRPTTADKVVKDSIWKAWTEADMQGLKGQTVFVDFTAEWCLTCKVNKKLVLETDGFEELTEKYKISLMRADWTKRDDTITQFLKSHGAVGVPAYFIQKPSGEVVSLGETISLGKIESYLK